VTIFGVLVTNQLIVHVSLNERYGIVRNVPKWPKFYTVHILNIACTYEINIVYRLIETSIASHFASHQYSVASDLSASAAILWSVDTARVTVYADGTQMRSNSVTFVAKLHGHLPSSLEITVRHRLREFHSAVRWASFVGPAFPQCIHNE